MLTPRPPGSNFKPFVYGTALESNYSAASTINDAPLIRGSYRPQNYENNFLGPVTLRYALKESRNVPTVRLFDQLGSDKVLAFAAKFGFQTQNFPQYDLTVALGSQDVKPIEMVTAYSAIANGGYKVEPWFIKQITDLSNQRVYKSEPVVVCQRVAACTGQAPVDRPSIGPSLTPNESGINEIAQANPDTYHSAPQIIDPRIAYILNSMLRSVVEEGSGQGVQRALRRGDLMGKTGTTNGPQELWFSGFNADIATTVFVGFDQPASLGEREQGASVAVPIWIDYMRVALENSPENVMQRPDGLVDRLIDKTTGALATPGDANTIFEYFRIENAPQPLPDTQTPSNSTENQGEEELSTEILF
ncbi:MAG: hypothetical protein COC19_07555 [SAR86 cluster bacterium]|uniref:Penicillin-binding protein transpeptidase domain-containing protein n=1 Tax=SAR86 cluster bacterium TaxID=2030880 RepID=A0A2A4MGY8_9GAMM|nr:MAG: hypothetical protein COC19_07555 [SAR86 cluster bacterium]